MTRGGISHRIIGLADALVGHRIGGLAQVNVLNSVFIGGMSGSGNADAAIDAKTLVPVMVQKGYSKPFAAAMTAASGVIAPIIPPGIGLLIYGFIADVSVGRLFIGGIVPGLLLALGLMIAVHIVSKRRGYGRSRAHRAPMRRGAPARARGGVGAVPPGPDPRGAPGRRLHADRGGGGGGGVRGLRRHARLPGAPGPRAVADRRRVAGGDGGGDADPRRRQRAHVGAHLGAGPAS